jgi:hypothetical protein
VKFKKGDKVRLLDKTCGPIHGLRYCLKRDYEEADELIPRFGTIKRIVRDDFKWGTHYKVEPEFYNAGALRHREFMFYEDDLALRHHEWFEDELFVI